MREEMTRRMLCFIVTVVGIECSFFEFDCEDSADEGDAGSNDVSVDDQRSVRVGVLDEN